MIDVSTAVYNRVKTAVSSLCTNVSMIESDTPPGIPYVTVVQTDNPIARSRTDSDSFENAVYSVIEINVYTNGASSLLDNKKIQALVNDELVGAGYVRKYGFRPIKNVLDTSITRYVARYESLCDGEAFYNN